MKISLKSVCVGICAGILVAFLVATLPTAINWYDNFGGIFRSDSGTDWSIVFETWFSWFWPVVIISVPVALLLHAWISNRRAANAT
jgi:hypothetical protein